MEKHMLTSLLGFLLVAFFAIGFTLVIGKFLGHDE